MRALLTLAAALSLFGCAGRAMLRDMTPPPASAARELEATPFFPQVTHQCGPAALATVLGASGVETTPEALVDAVYVPGLHGSLQVELLAASRRAGRIPYPVGPALDALIAEIDAGRPVLVLQNLGFTETRKRECGEDGEEGKHGVKVSREGKIRPGKGQPVDRRR